MLGPRRRSRRVAFGAAPRYRDEQARESDRTIWPTIIGYAETVRLLAAWCEFHQDFRRFRTDRIVAAEFLDERHGLRPSELRTSGDVHSTTGARFGWRSRTQARSPGDGAECEGTAKLLDGRSIGFVRRNGDEHCRSKSGRFFSRRRPSLSIAPVRESGGVSPYFPEEARRENRPAGSVRPERQVTTFRRPIASDAKEHFLLR